MRLFGNFINHANQKINNVRPEVAFLVISLTFGMAFAMATPPFQAPDEIVHFFRAYQISEFQFMPEKIGDGYGGNLPASIPIAANRAGQGIQQNSNVRYNTSATTDLLRQPLNTSITTPLKFVNSYSPIAYLFQLPGIIIGRIFNLPPVLILYLGRIFSVIFWSLALFVAISITPIGKWSMAALGLTPMAIFLSGSVSIDIILNASAFLLLAYSFNVRAKNTVNRNDIIIIGAIATIIALVKIIYLPLIVVLFFLTTKSFGGFKRKLIILALVITIPLLLGLGWTQATSQAQSAALKTTSSLVGFRLMPKQQLHFIIIHPVSYARIVWNTYFTNNGNHLPGEYIGTLGSLDVALPIGVVVAGYVIIVMTLASEPETQIRFTRKYKFLLLGSAALVFVAISTAMYLYSSPFKYVIIVGLQGRYFIPLAILSIPLAMNTFKGVSIAPESRRALVVRGSVILLTTALIITSFRYYAVLGTIIDKITA